MTSGSWNIGSIVNHVANIVGWGNIPTSISGTTFDNIVEQEINYAELYASETIDSSAIPEKYQPAIIDFVHSKILLSIDEQNGGINSVKLGDLNVSSSNSSYSSIAQQLREDAINRLKELHRTVRFKRVLGGY
jgi:alpha-L-arabinofuranosidase